MKHQEDHFSPVASHYAVGRPTYPSEVYQFLASQSAERNLAWDCATGTGQAATDLARHFSKVIATDISKDLLSLAPADNRIVYRVAPAEESGIESGTVDLLTVAQAILWFDLPKFWEESNRVLKDGGVFAFWGYNWPSVNQKVDSVLSKFRPEILPFWPERSALLHQEYVSIRPPFQEIASPAFQLTARWNLESYLSHLTSWSATRYHRERTGEDVIKEFEPLFRNAWVGEEALVTWPLVLKVFRKNT